MSVLSMSHIGIPRPRVRVAAAAAIIIIIVSTLPKPSRAGIPLYFGSISAISGSVTISRAGHSFAAVYGSPIQTGDTLATGLNGGATITLAGGSQIELTESTTLVISGYVPNPKGGRGGVTVTLLGGLIHSIVVPSAGTPSRFEVRTPNSVASAWGTAFETSYATGAVRGAFKGCTEFTDVSVHDGVVQVSNPAKPLAPAVAVHPGEHTTVPCGQAALLASAAATGITASGWTSMAGAGASGFGGIAELITANDASSDGSIAPAVTAESPVQ